MSDTRALVYLGTSHFFWSCYPVFHLLWVIRSKSSCSGNQHHTLRPRLLERPLKLPQEILPAALWGSQVLSPLRMKKKLVILKAPSDASWQGLIFRDVACTPSLKSRSAMCSSSVGPPREIVPAKSRALCACTAFGFCSCKSDCCQLTLFPAPLVKKKKKLCCFLHFVKMFFFLWNVAWDVEGRIIFLINLHHLL